MAINQPVKPVAVTKAKSEGGMLEIAKAIVHPLSSLKLTVFLLSLSVLVVWIATLDQTRIDIWELKAKHFGNVLVYVPFQTLFPPAWFPNLQDIPGGFYIPSGITLIFGMLINLTAAHSLRFKLQAKGKRLIAGILTGLFCGAITWIVAFGGTGLSGLQDQPFSYTSLWMWLQVALLGLSLAAVASSVLMSKEKQVERFIAGVFGVVGFCVIGFTLFMGEKFFVGDSAMRILWQLIQATVAALTGLLACLLLFRRKAGIVLLHLGVAGLLLNEIFVTVTNEEQQMEIVEGATVSEAVDIRAIEMAVIDRSDPEFDTITSIPSARLRSEKIVSHDDLPFDIECLDYFVNSDLVDVKPGDRPRSTAGLGLSMDAIEMPQIAGAEASKQSDVPAAYVRLIHKDDRSSIGTYLIGLLPYRSNFVDTVTVDGNDYKIGLRFKRVYKPYSIKLNDVTRENYLGTEIAQMYASDIVLTDFERNTSTEQNIWMNNPLRYGGETFYQQGYDAEGETERTVLQIVKNRGWMIPYLCCMFVVVGLIRQFGTTLLSFLEKQQESRVAQRTRKVWIPAIVLLVILGGYAAGQLGKAVSGKDVKDDMRLDLLGKIPVTHGGRVQPLDSVARNLARQLGNREEVVYRKNKQSAMRWMADTIFESPGFADDYQFLRIEDLNVHQALSLPERKRFKYSWAELQKSESELIRLLQEAAVVPPEQWSSLQNRLNEVYGKMRRVVELKRALTDPADLARSGNLMERLDSSTTAMSLEQVPLAVATTDSAAPWISLPAALSREWLNELANEYDEWDVQKLASMLVEKLMIEPVRKNLMREEVVKRILEDEDSLQRLQELVGVESQVDVSKKLLEPEYFESIPPEFYADQLEMVRKEFEPKIDRGRKIIEVDVVRLMKEINGVDKDRIEPPQAIGLAHLKEVGPAYTEGDAEKFNREVQAYLNEIDANSPLGLSQLGLDIESIYNRFSPFYLAMVIYLFAFIVSCLAWVVWHDPLKRAAYSLVVLGLLIQVGGIVARVMISGRPPVTNLYSSFLFVSAAGIFFILIAEKITKLGVGTLMASLLGFLVLMWAWAMSIGDGDTFTVLQAVLDTQFWLSTHVICISLGYGATIVAGFLGIGFVFGAMVTKVFNKETRRLFANVIYGFVCFGLLFSFFGTVLGGLWADDSWGRFWGWDPKENGALMIVLWNALVLHARWAGLIRERGLAVLAVLGNVVTIWSWEAVNQMGVGLHAYGGSEGNRMMYVAIFWLANLVIVGIAMIPIRYWLSYRNESSGREKVA